MTKKKKPVSNMLNAIVENNYDREFLIADGFDDAVIGISNDFTEPRIIYSVSKCLDILMKEMSHEEAMEYFTFNISGAYVGENTPIWCWDNL